MNNKTCVEKSLVGENCASDTQCVSTSVCDTTCKCPENTYNMKNKTCVEKSLVGENCASDTQCVNTSVCDTTCKCPENTYNMNNKTCVEKSLIGASCDFDHQCINTSVCDTNICSCPAETYNLDNSTCVKQLDHGAICSGHHDECRVDGTSCQDDRQNGMRCICSNNHFWDSEQTACRDVNDLKVDINNISSSESSISISWNQPLRKLTSSLTYKVTGIGTIDETSVHGANISGLTNGTQYSYHIKTVLVSEYYNISTDEVNTEQIYTKQSHGGQCDNETIKCVPSSPLMCLDKKCRCPFQQRYSVNGDCYGVSDIQVQNIIAITNTTSATLKWSESPIESVEYNIALQPQEGNTTSGPNAEGATLNNLTQGRRYHATITSKVLADSIYEELSTDATHIFWMKPEKSQGGGQGVRIAKDNYNFTFIASPGDVAKYEVNISNIINNSETSSTTITGLPLKPAKTYSYTIIAYNGIGDRSDDFSNNFTVNAERPGKVEELHVTGKTDSSLNVQWKTPIEPNGNLIGYRITLSRKDREEYCLELEIPCTNCLGKWPVSNQDKLTSLSCAIVPSTSPSAILYFFLFPCGVWDRIDLPYCTCHKRQLKQGVAHELPLSGRWVTSLSLHLALSFIPTFVSCAIVPSTDLPTFRFRREKFR
ncbi:receptor-type tyrosine-protein phosphatase f [Plakobranchus ocellatus]|uniref:Receptor-type tyrosine-protein phosphatase f n=1 Tax=Plakobranchus ocellatus TaxID=259542 RepID=A0AAV4ANW6_9GAST|nr:receptor-type tyrosine-protein phosphatase f [Plakobranchus ocellatus]